MRCLWRQRRSCSHPPAVSTGKLCKTKSSTHFHTLSFFGGRGWITRAAHLKKPRRGFFPRRTVRRVDAVLIHPLCLLKDSCKTKSSTHFHTLNFLGGRGWIRTTILSVCPFLPCQKMQHSSHFSGTARNARCIAGIARTLKVGCKVGYFSGPGAYSDSTPETACAVASSRPVTAWEYQP